MLTVKPTPLGRQSSPACVAWPSFVPTLSSCPVLLPHVPFGPRLLHTVRLCRHRRSPDHAAVTARKGPVASAPAEWGLAPEAQRAASRSPGALGCSFEPPSSLSDRVWIHVESCPRQIFIGERGQEPSTKPGGLRFVPLERSDGRARRSRRSATGLCDIWGLGTDTASRSEVTREARLHAAQLAANVPVTRVLGTRPVWAAARSAGHRHVWLTIYRLTRALHHLNAASLSIRCLLGPLILCAFSYFSAFCVLTILVHSGI